jgi:hypothetical protein
MERDLEGVRIGDCDAASRITSQSLLERLANCPQALPADTRFEKIANKELNRHPGLLSRRPNVVLDHRLGPGAQEGIRLALAFCCRPGIFDCGDAPATVIEGSLDEVERIGAPVRDATEPDDHFGIFGANLFRVAPYLTQIVREVLRARMNDLIAVGVVDSVGAADEPVAEPLVGDIGPHAVVRGRGDHPVEPSVLGFGLERLGLPAVRQSHGSRDVGRRCVVALRRHADERAPGEVVQPLARRLRRRAHHQQVGGHCQVLAGYRPARHQRIAGALRKSAAGGRSNSYELNELAAKCSSE